MKIAFIGSGNLATHLSQALAKAGNTIVQVYSRNLSHASELAELLGCEAVDSLDAVCHDVDAYILSVKDDAVETVAQTLCPSRQNCLFIHTAGSVSIEALHRHAPHCAVLYPLQTFSKARPVDFSVIPCLVEATDDASLHTVETLAHSISGNVRMADSDSRKHLHLAAVLSSNLANHCYRLAERFLQTSPAASSLGADAFTLLRPLILETASKVTTMSPRDAQTGPMRRNDKTVMADHLSMLSDTHTRQIYQLMAASIYSDEVNGGR